MKKIILIISCLFFASNVYAQEKKPLPEQASARAIISIKEVFGNYETPQKASDGKGGFITYKQKRRKAIAITFHDKNGKVIKKIEFVKEKRDRKIHKKTEYVFGRGKKYVAITNRVTTRLSDDEHWKTGQFSKDSNEITYYDERGNELFRLEGANFRCEAISENGERIVCIYWAPELLEAVSSKVSKNPPKCKVYVLNKKGQIIHEREDFYIYSDPIISPSGEWLVYEHGNDIVKRLNTNSFEVISIPMSKVPKLRDIRDDGGILVREFKGLDDKGRRKFLMKAYSPEEDILRDLEVVYED
ncbi:MAG: hypothetical protein IMF07_01565 [Proteobacteria bacterium]|nr:hypothetical protein [Pseudomonadota bacterium]